MAKCGNKRRGKAWSPSYRKFVKTLYVSEGLTDLRQLKAETGVPQRTLARWREEEGWDILRERQNSDLDTAYFQSRVTLCRLVRSLNQKIQVEDIFTNKEDIEWLVQQLRFMANINESLMKQAPLHSAKIVKESIATTKELIRQSEEYTPEQKVLICDALLNIQADLITNVINTVEKLT